MTNDIKRIYRVTSRLKAVPVSVIVSLNCVGNFKMHFLYIRIGEVK